MAIRYISCFLVLVYSSFRRKLVCWVWLTSFTSRSLSGKKLCDVHEPNSLWLFKRDCSTWASTSGEMKTPFSRILRSMRRRSCRNFRFVLRSCLDWRESDTSHFTNVVEVRRSRWFANIQFLFEDFGPFLTDFCSQNCGFKHWPVCFRVVSQNLWIHLLSSNWRCWFRRTPWY